MPSQWLVDTVVVTSTWPLGGVNFVLQSELGLEIFRYKVAKVTALLRSPLRRVALVPN